MQGMIVRLDERSGGGLIRSSQGERFNFRREDWNDPDTRPRVGQSVDFDGNGDAARDVVVVGQAKASSEAVSNGTVLGVVSIVAAVLGLLPGIGLLLAIIALVTGIIGRRQAKTHGNNTGKLLATIGVAISCVVLVIDVILSIGLVAMLSSMRFK